MKDELLKMVGFSPLEVILLLAIGGMALRFWMFLTKESKDSTLAINNNTKAIEELRKDMVMRKVKKATQ